MKKALIVSLLLVLCGFCFATNAKGYPNFLSEATLTTQKAKSLVGKTPKEVAKAIKNLGDFVVYAEASGFGKKVKDGILDSPEDVEKNGLSNSAEDLVKANQARDCMEWSTLFCYLFDGDYQEVGMIRYALEHMSHCVNYVKKDGKYYVFDYTIDRMSNTIPVIELTKLEDYYSAFPNDSYKGTPINKASVLFMTAFPWNGKVKCPSQYGFENGKNVLPLPSNVKKASAKIIFNKNSDFSVTDKNYFDMFGNPKKWK